MPQDPAPIIIHDEVREVIQYKYNSDPERCFHVDGAHYPLVESLLRQLKSDHGVHTRLLRAQDQERRILDVLFGAQTHDQNKGLFEELGLDLLGASYTAPPKEASQVSRVPLSSTRELARYPWHELAKPGDHVLVSGIKHSNVSVTIQNYMKFTGDGKVFRCHSVSEGVLVILIEVPNVLYNNYVEYGGHDA